MMKNDVVCGKPQPKTLDTYLFYFLKFSFQKEDGWILDNPKYFI